MPQCVGVGDANPDIAGVGILYAFAIQAGLAVLASGFVWGIKVWMGEYRTTLGVGPMTVVQMRKYDQWEKIQEIAREALLAGNDAQLLTGTSLLMGALIQIKSLPFYHLHIIYDTVSFVAISICAASACSFRPDLPGIHIRYIQILIWFLLFLAYTIGFGVRLRSWNWDIPGHCYNTSKLALPSSAHPTVDNVYIALTFFYMYATVSFSVGLGEDFDDTTDERESDVLGVSMLQFPLHLYSLFALRVSNESLLLNGDTEQQWGFGQIVAITILGNNLLIIANGVTKYRDWNFEIDHPGQKRVSNVVLLSRFIFG